MLLYKCYQCKGDYPKENFHTNKTRKGGVNYRCKPCTSESTKKWRINNPERAASHHRKQLYGLSIEEFEDMYSKQRGKCASCAKDLPKYGRDIVIDHNHKTGDIRGILCHNCNDALGKLKDDATLVLKLYEYIMGVV